MNAVSSLVKWLMKMAFSVLVMRWNGRMIEIQETFLSKLRTGVVQRAEPVFRVLLLSALYKYFL